MLVLPLLPILHFTFSLPRSPDGVKIMVSSDGKTWSEAGHTGIKEVFRKCFHSLIKGSIPGMLSLVKAAEIKYIRLEFIENGTLSEMESKPLGVRFVELYGCPLETGPLAECGTHWTRVSTNSSAYRHIG